MLKDCLTFFKKQYEEHGGDKYILDSYVLPEATYILVGKDGEIKQILEIAKSKEVPDRTLENYDKFCLRDYYSTLIDINKPIDSKKVIHSNNYYSFFVKKENLTSGKLTQPILDNYYQVLANLEQKYKKSKQSIAIYEKTKQLYGEVELDKIQQHKEWIQNNIFTLSKKYPIALDKRYLKIFFEASDEKYRQEGNRYILPNVFNAAEYNVQVEEEIYGMPNDNTGLNAKKPYLKHKTRKNEVPYLICTQEVLLQKKFFDYLMNQVAVGKVNLYLNEEEIEGVANDKILSFKDARKAEFTGYYLRLQKGKEVEILDADNILHYTPILKNFYITRDIVINYDKVEAGLEYGNIEKIEQLIRMVNDRFFNKFLIYSYFGELPDKLRDDTIKQVILATREALFAWFYKGNTVAIRGVFPKGSKQLIKNSVCQGNMIRAKEQWLLRDAILNYLSEGKEHMSKQMNSVLEKLEQKVRGEQQAMIESDTEYFCAAGQVAYYLLSLNKTNKKMHALVNPLLNCKDDTKMKILLKRLFVRYNYGISQGAKKFNRLYGMVEGYIPERAIDDDAFLYGYLQDNLIYKKEEKGNE